MSMSAEHTTKESRIKRDLRGNVCEQCGPLFYRVLSLRNLGSSLNVLVSPCAWNQGTRKYSGAAQQSHSTMNTGKQEKKNGQQRENNEAKKVKQ